MHGSSGCLLQSDTGVNAHLPQDLILVALIHPLDGAELDRALLAALCVRNMGGSS